MTDHYLSTAEARAYTGFSLDTLYRAIKSGALKAKGGAARPTYTKQGGRPSGAVSYRFKLAWLDTWVADR